MFSLETSAGHFYTHTNSQHRFVQTSARLMFGPIGRAQRSLLHSMPIATLVADKQNICAPWVTVVRDWLSLILGLMWSPSTYIVVCLVCSKLGQHATAFSIHTFHERSNNWRWQPNSLCNGSIVVALPDYNLGTLCCCCYRLQPVLLPTMAGLNKVSTVPPVLLRFPTRSGG